MIIIEILGKIFIEILFEGIILGFFRLIGNGFSKLGNLFSGTEKPIDPIKVLEKKYLYKNIELTETLNSKLKIGLSGVILEVLDDKTIFAEFLTLNGEQIEFENNFVFELNLNQFKLKE